MGGVVLDGVQYREKMEGMLAIGVIMLCMLMLFAIASSHSIPASVMIVAKEGETKHNIHVVRIDKTNVTLSIGGETMVVNIHESFRLPNGDVCRVWSIDYSEKRAYFDCATEIHPLLSLLPILLLVIGTGVVVIIINYTKKQ